MRTRNNCEKGKAMSMLPPIIEPEELIHLVDKHATSKLEIEKLQKELATLRAKAEAYDDATEVWGIFKGGELNSSGKTRNTAIASAQKSAGYRNPHFDMWPIMKGLGYTCRKVLVVEEIEECKCDIKTKLVGDGCLVCNTELYKDEIEKGTE